MQRVRGKRQAKNLKKKLSTKNNTILFAKKNTFLLTSLPAAEGEKKISSSPHYLWQREKKKSSSPHYLWQRVSGELNEARLVQEVAAGITNYDSAALSTMSHHHA